MVGDVQIEQSKHGAVTVIRPQGPLTAQDAPGLEAEVRGALASSLGRVVLDVSAVPFLDSVGLESLVNTAEEFGRGGQSLKLCGVHETLGQVFMLTGTGDRFEWYEDVNAAVRSFLT